mmetsp:Transcript_34332/g.52619  ORF Transcript_34332/g.52619 Transcript_34332/m.52619 type:complete len:129 (-) Transcript_34332:871-1257(-)
MLEMMKNNKERADLKKKADISESLEEESASVSSPMIKQRQLPSELAIESQGSQRSKFLTIQNQPKNKEATNFNRRMSNFMVPSSPPTDKMLSVPGTPAGITAANNGYTPGIVARGGLPSRNESPASSN